MLWVLLLAALALLIGSSTGRLLGQREGMTRNSYAMIRAGCNAENGLEWARTRWLTALANDENAISPLVGSWRSEDGTDRAEISFTLLSDGSWNVRSDGFFGVSRRRIDARLPRLEQGVRASLAVTGFLSGNGIIRQISIPAQNHLINTMALSGVSLLTWTGEPLQQAETAAFRLRDPAKLAMNKLAGDFHLDHDPDEPLQLHTLQSVPQPIWLTELSYDTIAYTGYLRLGSDPEKQLLMHNKRLVIVADYIEILGNFEFDDSSEIWLIATHGIYWHTSNYSERSFRGLIWTAGGLTISSENQAVWDISGAVYAGSMRLDNTELRFTRSPADFLPEFCLPRMLELPQLENWRILSPEGD